MAERKVSGPFREGSRMGTSRIRQPVPGHEWVCVTGQSEKHALSLQFLADLLCHSLSFRSSVIHNCSHPNDDDVHFRITDEQIYKDIFNYIDFLFKTIKPRKVMFMAVDGVAPRAKMNQQRSRRFRTAKEALDKEQEAIKKGKERERERERESQKECILINRFFSYL